MTLVRLILLFIFRGYLSVPIEIMNQYLNSIGVYPPHFKMQISASRMDIIVLSANTDSNSTNGVSKLSTYTSLNLLTKISFARCQTP